jgi:hypothetical protein
LSGHDFAFSCCALLFASSFSTENTLFNLRCQKTKRGSFKRKFCFSWLCSLCLP